MLLDKDLKSLKIGYAGIGIMGSEIANHIFENGFDLTIYNRSKNKDKYQNLLQQGIKEAITIKDLANCNIIFTCLDDEISVFNFIEEILPNLQENSIIIDNATIGKKSAIKIGEILSQNNSIFMDAPVTGGDKGAKAGNLTIMIGGDRKYFDYLQPIFQTFSTLIKYCGEIGSGQAVKSINQLLCAINLTGVCEAFIAAEKMHIDPQIIIEICGSGMAGSKQLTAVGSEITKNNFNPGFKAQHLEKDLRLFLEGIDDTNLPFTKNAYNNFQDLIKNADFRDMGTQILLKYLKDKN